MMEQYQLQVWFSSATNYELRGYTAFGALFVLTVNGESVTHSCYGAPGGLCQNGVWAE